MCFSIARKTKKYIKANASQSKSESQVHLKWIRNVLISMGLKLISLIFRASRGECIKDNDEGMILTTVNLLKSFWTNIWKVNDKKNYMFRIPLKKDKQCIYIFSVRKHEKYVWSSLLVQKQRKGEISPPPHTWAWRLTLKGDWSPVTEERCLLDPFSAASQHIVCKGLSQWKKGLHSPRALNTSTPSFSQYSPQQRGFSTILPESEKLGDRPQAPQEGPHTSESFTG